ncbi:MAG: glycosyltransferase family 4 protein [Polaromonas sp.]|nr:glycosyltransferase family 4 protein [Polaromonas sp.]
MSVPPEAVPQARGKQDLPDVGAAETPVRPPTARRLRIAVFNRTFSPTGGGAERYSIALVEALAARHDVHVFAQDIDHRWPGVTYHRVAMPMRRPRWLNQLWYATATWWATRRGFDVVHSHEATWHGGVQTVHVLPVKHNLFHGLTGARRFSRWIKVVTSPRLLAYLALEKARFALKPGKRVVATSQTLRDVIEATYPACAPMLRVVSPGVTLPAAPADVPAARAALELPPAGRLIAFVANDYQKKGLGTLLIALAALPPDVHLAVVGNPSYIDRFQQEALSLKVADRVHFLGYRKDASPLYQAADVLAHPTLEDTFAMVVLEAMAHGLPVVVSDASHCGIASLLDDEANALILASPTDADELAGKLGRIFADAGLRQHLGDGARAFAAQWSWTTIAARQESIYIEAARSTSAASQP